MSQTKLFRIIVVIFVFFYIFSAVTSAENKEFNLNGLSIILDENTGNILQIAYPEVGVFVDTPPESAGFIDLAHIVGDSAKRATTRHAPAKITQPEANTITITWENLVYENNEHINGGIGAQVNIQKAPDDRSVIFHCTVTNNTQYPIGQAFFPDMWGLTEKNTLTATKGKWNPFAKTYPNTKAPDYTTDDGWCRVDLMLRWLDLGNYSGGLSMFQKKWQTVEPFGITAFLQRQGEDNSKPRLCIEQKITIDPGETWDSGQFWFTGHK